jgi:hypothetical protein
MTDSFNKKEAERWRKTASRLALALAMLILASGIIGSWMSSESRALASYKKANERLRKANSNVTETLTTSTNDLIEYKELNEELEQEILNLQLENASLKAMIAE